MTRAQMDLLIELIDLNRFLANPRTTSPGDLREAWNRLREIERELRESCPIGDDEL